MGHEARKLSKESVPIYPTSAQGFVESNGPVTLELIRHLAVSPRPVSRTIEITIGASISMDSENRLHVVNRSE